MKKIWLVLFFTLSVLFSIVSNAAEPARYSSNLELLFIPEVKIDDQVYIRGVLHLKSNGEYRVNALVKLEPKQADLLEKIESIPCGPADNLGKLAAMYALIDGHINYCLVKNPSITVEGGKIFSYLLIENGTVQVIGDFRDDLFAGCCDFLSSTLFDTMQFGYNNEGNFIEQTSLKEINLNNEYILRLSSENSVTQEY